MGSARGYESVGGDQGFLTDEPLIRAAASELNSPLVLVRQLSLAMADDNLDDDERRLLAERLTLTAERAIRLTKQLGMNADVPQLLSLEPVNAVTLCREVVHELLPLFRAHGKSIAVRPRSKIPLLIADRTLLRRILVGFADNAVHFGSEDKPVELTIAVNGDKVRMGVRDYGPAVPSDAWQRLNGRVARRSAMPLPRRPQTSGVALVAARRIAEMMGGTTGVTRHRDGATFYVDMHVSNQMSLL